MIRYKEMPFINGKYEILFPDGIKAIVTHEDYRKEYCNTFPNIEFYDTNKNIKLETTVGMCAPFGYTEEEIDDLLMQREQYFNK